MNVGAVIIAAGMSSRMKAFKPLLSIGEKSMVSHVIETFKEAGITTIVVVTGNHSEELNKELERHHVISLYNEKYENGEMFDSAKVGLEYLAHTCERILFTPVDVPLFLPSTVKTLLKIKAEVAKPVYHGRGGHPLMLSKNVANKMLLYNGDGGMKGALASIGAVIKRVEVEDEAILMDTDTKEEFEKMLIYYKNRKKVVY